MKARLIAFAVITHLAIPLLGAQDIVRESPPKPPVAREFNPDDPVKHPEITVVLDPALDPQALIPQEVPQEPALEKPVVAPAEAIDPSSEVTDPDPAVKNPPAEVPQTSPEPLASKPQRGLAVRVEKLQVGSGSIDPSQVKLLAPFPAKPLTPVPAGWCLVSSQNVPPFTREVELSPGNKITLTVRPHLLVPDADGAAVFKISEPGFDPSLGYRQNATVGAILAHSIHQLDVDSKALGIAIDQLQQILVSLPQTQAEEPKPALKPELKPVLKPVLKPSPPRQR